MTTRRTYETHSRFVNTHLDGASVGLRRYIRDPVSGLSHLGGFALAVAGVVYLLASGPHDALRVAVIVTYGVCLMALYAASSVYHVVVASPAIIRRLRVLDHIAIYLMVAGTCTPLFMRAFSGRIRVAMLGAIWGVAVLGIAFKLLWSSAPRALYTATYVLMGWGVFVQWRTLQRGLPPAAFQLVVAGGLTYTLGAVVYALRRPDPFPKWFGFHEIWHVLVLVASVLHFCAIAIVARA